MWCGRKFFGCKGALFFFCFFRSHTHGKAGGKSLVHIGLSIHGSVILYAARRVRLLPYLSYDPTSDGILIWYLVHQLGDSRLSLLIMGLYAHEISLDTSYRKSFFFRNLKCSILRYLWANSLNAPHAEISGTILTAQLLPYFYCHLNSNWIKPFIRLLTAMPTLAFWRRTRNQYVLVTCVIDNRASWSA